jgi:hypothetical protein
LSHILAQISSLDREGLNIVRDRIDNLLGPHGFSRSGEPMAIGRSSPVIIDAQSNGSDSLPETPRKPSLSERVSGLWDDRVGALFDRRHSDK